MTTGTRQYLLLLYPPDARALMQALAKQLRAADLHVDLRPLPEPGDLPATLGEASEQGALVLLAVSAPLQETLAAALSSGMAAVPSGRWLVLQLDGTERLALPEAVVVLAWPRQAKGAAEKRIRQVTLDRIRVLVGATPSRMQPAVADPVPVPGAMEARKKSGKVNKKKDSNRDNFSKEIRLALSRRVGGYCSKPGCKNHTSGPHSESSKVTDTGVAAHITAAAPGGPRYNSKLESEQRSSADNGIWLCQNHAKLIDSDAATYPEALLREWKAQAESQQQDRQNGIHPSRRDWNWPGAYDFAPYRKERRQGFVGRRWLLERVRAWAADPKAARALLIGADFGVGKTAFLAQLLDQEAQIASALETPSATEIDPLQNTGPGLPVLAQHFCRWEENAYLSPGLFVQSLAAQLKEELPAYRKLLEADNASQLRDSLDQAEAEPLLAFQQGVVAPLARIPAPATQRLLVVDALDEALDYRPGAGGSTRFTIVDLLAKEACNLPTWLRVVASSRSRDEVLVPLRQGFFAIEEINAEESANLSDIHDYVQARCEKEPLAAILSRAGLSASDTADVLQNKSGGKFLYAVRVLNDLASGALTLKNCQTLDALPPGMDGFYEDTFQRRFPEAGDYDSVKPLLALLIAQREPMGYQQLAATLQQSVDQIGRCLPPLEDLLRFRQPPEAEAAFSSSDDWRISFDHVSLEQWLTERSGGKIPRARAGRFAVDRAAAAKQIHTWALAEVQAGRAHTWPYLVRHLASHLSPDERGEVIGGQLLQFPWLQARLKLAGLNALLGDFNLLADHPISLPPDLQRLGHALRQAAHVLSNQEGWDGQEQLASQLLGRLPKVGALERLRRQAEEWIQRAGEATPLAASLLASEALLRSLQVGCEVRTMIPLQNGYLASGSTEGAIRFWDLETGECVRVIEEQDKRVEFLVVLHDGRIASSTGCPGDNSIRLWDPSSGICASVLTGHTSLITSLVVLRDGRLASGSGCDGYGSDFTIRLWDPVNGECTGVLTGHRDWVNSLTVVDEQRLASGSMDGTIRLWNLDSCECIAVFEGNNPVTALAFMGNDRLAFVSSNDCAIQLWELGCRECSAFMHGHTREVNALQVLGDGRLASGSGDGTVRLWNQSGECLAVFRAHGDYITSLTVLGNERISSGSFNSIRIWDVAQGGVAQVDCGYELHGHNINALAVLPDGCIASASDDCSMRIWKPKAVDHNYYDLQLECSSINKVLIDGGFLCLGLIPCGHLASGSTEGAIRFWDLETGECVRVIEERDKRVEFLVVLRDGRIASSTGCPGDNSIRLWDPSSGVCTSVLTGHASLITSLVVLRDGRLASGSGYDGYGSDCTIRLWDPVNGECTGVLTGHRDWVNSLAVVDEQRLASGSVDGTIRLWNLDGCECIAVFEGDIDTVDVLALLDDDRIASGSSDHTIRLWDPASPDGAPRVLFVGEAAITALAWLPSHQLLVAGDASGRLHWLKLGPHR